MLSQPNENPQPIVMLVRAMDGGGAQRDAIELANGLFAVGWPMLVATLDSSGPLAGRLAPAMPFVDLGQGRKLRMARALPALAGMIRHLRPQAVIASEASANGLLSLAARCAGASGPAIILREVAAPLSARQHDPFWQNRLGYALAPWFYPRADRVLSLTEGVRQELIRHFGVKPGRAVNLGTNAVMTAAQMDRLVELPVRQPDLLVAVGRLSPEKDFASLIAAFSVLRQTRALRLTILGEGPERDNLENQIERLGLGHCITLAGYVSDPTRCVQSARLLVSPSRHEGFGNAIVEALASGTPVVATDAPHGPREILDGGRVGTLVPPGNVAALAHGIDRALDLPLDRAALRQRARDYTTERAVQRMAEVFADLDLSAHKVMELTP